MSGGAEDVTLAWARLCLACTLALVLAVLALLQREERDP